MFKYVIADSDVTVTYDDVSGDSEPVKAENVTEEKNELNAESVEGDLEEYETSAQVVIDTVDYSDYFANLQSLAILNVSVLIAIGLSLAFGLGLKR